MLGIVMIDITLFLFRCVGVLTQVFDRLPTVRIILQSRGLAWPKVLTYVLVLAVAW